MAIASWHVTIAANTLCQTLLGSLLTRKHTVGFVGRSGKHVRSFHFKGKRMEYYLPINILYWRMGFCGFGPTYVSAGKKAAVAVAGTFSTLILATTLFWLSLTHGWPYLWQQFFFILLSTSALFILLFLYRRNRKDFSMTNNLVFSMDLSLLPELLRLRGFEKKFMPAVALHEQKKYLEAAAMIEDLIKEEPVRPEAYKTGIQAYYQAREFNAALAMFDKFAVAYSLTPVDRDMAGNIKHALGMYPEARKDYDDAIDLNPDEPAFYNNRGYLLTRMQLYAEAITDLDKAIELAPDLAFAYNNRGFANIKLGRLAEGLRDVEKSILLDPENAWAWRNLGIYHEAAGDKQKALELYRKAKQINPHTDDIDDLIARLQ